MPTLQMQMSRNCIGNANASQLQRLMRIIRIYRLARIMPALCCGAGGGFDLLLFLLYLFRLAKEQN